MAEHTADAQVSAAQPADTPSPRHLVVVGGGMVAHRLVEALRDRDTAGTWRTTILAEEPRPPYDRVALTTYFSGRRPEDLHLGHDELWSDPLVTLRKGTPATAIDRQARTVTDDLGRTERYDALVLATGSYAFVPPVPGADLPGVFVYRTLDDVAALRGWVDERSRELGRTVRGAVVGGGLLGLEAAGALQALGVPSTVVEFAPRLMALQVDEGGGEALRRLITNLGIEVRTSTATSRLKASHTGQVSRMDFADGTHLDVDVVVFATGVRPRDALAREAGLAVGERGGVVVDDVLITPPYEWKAIGNSQTLAVALDIPGGALSAIRNAGGRAVVEQEPLIEITAVRAVEDPEFATPVPAASPTS